MTELEIINIVKSIKKGTFVRMVWQSKPTILKAKTIHKGIEVRKETIGVVRFGIEYSNMQANQNKVVGAMTWGSWEDGNENYIITHTNGKKYLRVYTTTIKPIVKYFLNGVETTKQFLIDNGIISSSDSNHTECFSIALENVLSIG